MRNLFFLIFDLVLLVSFCNAKEAKWFNRLATDLVTDWGIDFLKELGIDIRPVEGENGVIAFDWELNAVELSKGLDTGAILFGELKADGTRPLRGNVSNIQDVINLTGEFYYCHWITINTGFRKRGDFKVKTDYLYYIGFKPFKFEADNNFENTNYVFQPFVGFDIPFTDIVPYFWNRIAKPKEQEHRPLTSQPIKVYVGYSSVKTLRGNNSFSEKDKRAELEVDYQMSLVDEFIFEMEGHYFFDISSRNEKKYFEVAITYPIGNKAQLILKWIKGSLPPTFIESDSITTGIRFTF